MTIRGSFLVQDHDCGLRRLKRKVQKENESARARRWGVEETAAKRERDPCRIKNTRVKKIGRSPGGDAT